MTENTNQTEATRGRPKYREGVVVSDKMDKTILVAVSSKVKHPIYKKYVVQTKKFSAHDESNQCGIGDTVRIIESRPISKNKRWRVTKLIQKAK